MNKLIRENKQLKLELEQKNGKVLAIDRLLNDYRINQNLSRQEKDRDIHKLEFEIAKLEIENAKLRAEKEKQNDEIRNLEDEELTIECRICTKKPSGENYFVSPIRLVFSIS